MAEKIVKPKQFTKEWYRYVWDYYKIHIICAVIAAILAVVTVFDVLNKVDYDLNMHYIARSVLSSDVSERLASVSSTCIEDINGDEKKVAFLSQLNFTDEAMMDGNQIMALENKLLSVLATDEEMLYLFDKVMLQDILSMPATEGVFVPVSAWCKEEMPEELCYGDYAVNLSHSAVFGEMGVDSSDLYVVVRMNYKPEEAELRQRYENSISFANMLVRE